MYFGHLSYIEALSLGDILQLPAISVLPLEDYNSGKAMNKENKKLLKSKDPHKTEHDILKEFFLESLLEGSIGNVRWKKKILLTEWLWQFHHESRL